jgi:hypothetical protein
MYKNDVRVFFFIFFSGFSLASLFYKESKGYAIMSVCLYSLTSGPLNFVIHVIHFMKLDLLILLSM